MSLLLSGRAASSFHFVGILGSGMSAIAQFLRWSGYTVSGSDRSLDSPDTARVREHLDRLGCRLCPQDGSGLSGGAHVAVVSSAIEKDNADMAAAATRSVALVHRSDVLAAIVTQHRGIAVAGTSGKSTVTGLLFDCLAGCGLSPSLLCGAALSSVSQRGAFGNAWKGDSDLLVFEADESDGTVVKYHPYLSLLLNISHDHTDVDETARMLRQLAEQSRRVVVNADDRRCAAIPHAASFGVEFGTWRPDSVSQLLPQLRFAARGTDFSCALPGAHNLSNALAACAACTELGCSHPLIARALAGAGRIARRFETLSSARGVTVIDDFAHNPAKIEAAMRTAQQMSKRVFAVFQPHGFTPTRFVRPQLEELFSRLPREADRVLILPIYYAGGTVQRDISSGDIAAAIRTRTVLAPESREACTRYIARHAVCGDVVLLMGARDPSLPGYARQVAAALS